MAEIALAEMQSIGNIVNRQLFLIMLLQIYKSFTNEPDFLLLRRGKLSLCVRVMSVELYEKGHKNGKG